MEPNNRVPNYTDKKKKREPLEDIRGLPQRPELSRYERGKGETVEVYWRPDMSGDEGGKEPLEDHYCISEARMPRYGA